MIDVLSRQTKAAPVDLTRAAFWPCAWLSGVIALGMFALAAPYGLPRGPEFVLAWACWVLVGVARWRS